VVASRVFRSTARQCHGVNVVLGSANRDHSRALAVASIASGCVPAASIRNRIPSSTARRITVTRGELLFARLLQAFEKNPARQERGEYLVFFPVVIRDDRRDPASVTPLPTKKQLRHHSHTTAIEFARFRTENSRKSHAEKTERT